MLVSELRKEVDKYNKKELTNIIVELYKRIPKNKKEDYDIDSFIVNIKNKTDRKPKEVSFEELQNEIIYFLECVDNEYYVVPNKIISKKERSSWRFKVKKYYKELNNILPSSQNGYNATILLIEIFKRLSIGSNTLLFVNWETFRALGISQADYYDTIMKRILHNGYRKKLLEDCIELLDVLKDPYELSYDMFYTFISNLKTRDVKEISLELLNNKVDKLKQKLKETKNSHEKFNLEEDINNFVECILEINLKLSNYESGIKYFHSNYIAKDIEIKEYILLGKLEKLDLQEEWLKEYESNINKIEFRDSLNEKYYELKESSYV
jgi:hypothetical protein